jgi:hypothetical protein
MGPVSIILLSPCLYLLSGILQGKKPVLIQQFFPEPAIED